MCSLVITPAADGARGSLLAKADASSRSCVRVGLGLGLELGLGLGSGLGLGLGCDRMKATSRRYRRGVRGCSGCSSLTAPPLLSPARYGLHLDVEMTTLAALRPRRCYRRELLCRTVQNRRLDLITISSPANLALDAAARRQRGLRAMFPPLPPEHRCVLA